MDRDVLVQNGKQFISSKVAAVRYGFTRDYIGQLCRGNKVSSQLIGRTWYVHEVSLKKYIAKTDELRRDGYRASKLITETPAQAGVPTLETPVIDETSKPKIEIVLPQPTIAPVVSPIQIKSESPTETFSTPHADPQTDYLVPLKRVKRSSYVEEVRRESHATPIRMSGHGVATREHARSSSHLFLATATLVVAMVFFVSSMMITQSGTTSFSRSQIASINSIVDSISSVFSSFTNSIRLATSSIQNLFSGSTPASGDPPGPQKGLVVVPQKGDNSKEEIDKIKKNFSDDVKVVLDDSGTSGVIVPQFKSRTSDQYLFVMVPVKESTTTASTTRNISSP